MGPRSAYIPVPQGPLAGSFDLAGVLSPFRTGVVPPQGSPRAVGLARMQGGERGKMRSSCIS